MVCRVRRVPRVPADLKFSGLALDRLAGDRASSFERAKLEWQFRWTVRGNAGARDHGFAEIDEMHVVEALTTIDEHPVEIVVHTLSCIACGFHRRGVDRAVCSGDRDVEIVVLTRLMAEQRINAPAAVEPHVDPVLFEPVEELDDIRGVHHRHRPIMLPTRSGEAKRPGLRAASRRTPGRDGRRRTPCRPGGGRARPRRNDGSWWGSPGLARTLSVAARCTHPAGLS